MVYFDALIGQASLFKIHAGALSQSYSSGGRTCWGGVTCPPRDEILLSFQVPTGDWETDRYMRALVKCINNLAVVQAAAIGFLGSKVPKKVKRRDLDE